MTQAVVLHTHRIGELHKGVTLLTRDIGIISAIAHGAKKTKSKLRSSTESFCLSTVYLYLNPVKQSYKITDMTVREHYGGLRTSLVRFFTASLWSEVVLKSYGGGDCSPPVFDLLTSSFRWLDQSEEQKSIYISFQFLWRFLALSGYGSELDSCSNCGRRVEPQETILLPRQTSGFYCSRCISVAGSVALPLSPGSRSYLKQTVRQPIGSVLRVSLDNQSVEGLRAVMYELIQGALETRLNSLMSSKGMI